MRRLEILVGLSMAVALSAPGCGGSSRRADVPAGPMPAGGSFTGIWHSPQYGEMQLVQTGNRVVGCYVHNERRGRIQGTVQGNLMRFEWSERREMVIGRPTMTRGRGYFQYLIGEDGDHYIRGEWGPDDNETGGGPWNAVRDRRRTRRPNPECTDADQGEGRQGDSFEGGGDWGSGSGSDRDDGLGDL
jgi:hypothetical protein